MDYKVHVDLVLDVQRNLDSLVALGILVHRILVFLSWFCLVTGF